MILGQEVLRAEPVACVRDVLGVRDTACGNEYASFYTTMHYA